MAFLELRLENGGFLVIVFEGAFLNWSRWIFALVLPPTLSACMGTCNCFDVPPNWVGGTTIAALTRIDNEDRDAAVAFEDDPTSCNATMTRGQNVIAFAVQDGTCTKTGGAALVDGGDSRCALEYSDNAPDGGLNGNSTLDVSFRLGAKDETYLGGLDFKFDLVCSDGTQMHQPETFSTRTCED